MRVPSLALRVRGWSQGAPPRSCDSNGEPLAGLAKWSTQYGNLPQRYMLRKARKLNYITPVASQCFANEVLTSRIQDFTLERPWTDDYRRQHEEHPNMIGSPAVYAQPIKEEDWMWFRGDRVEVLRGKDKGKQGYINYIVQEKNWVCVEGLNCKYETVRIHRMHTFATGICPIMLL